MTMTPLSRPHAEMKPSYDAVVVGSGYGGGVAASRLARMGLSVAVLERGEEIPPGEFPDTLAKAAEHAQVTSKAGRIGRRTALFDLHVNDDVNVLVGCGLGGTSLINANVAIEPDPRVFERPGWPMGIVDDDLAESFRRARDMLRPAPFPAGPDWPGLNKLRALEIAGERLSARAERPPINVCFEDGPNAAGVFQPACNMCGDCCSGCNTGAKTTTYMTYLADAARHGAEIFCSAAVRHVERRGERWAVVYDAVGLGRERFDAAPERLSAATVVLAGGALGSTGILLRSRAEGLPLSLKLGTSFSGNGDAIAFGYNNDRPIDGIGLGHRAAGYDHRRDPIRPVGPTITGLVDLRATAELDDGVVIEEGAIPGGIAGAMPAVMAAAAAALGRDTDAGDLLSERAREVESLVHGPYRGAVNHTQTFLVMSHDGSDGTVRLDGDRIAVDWPAAGEKPGFAKVADRLRDAVEATGGTYVPNPIWTEALGHELVTVHPLGGCPMGRDARTGVVDGDCRVYAGVDGTDVHEGLLVCDGSVVPGSLGVNPLLTISAVSERAMARLARARGLEIEMAPLPPLHAGKPARGSVGIRFTERMAGELAADGGPPLRSDFVLTIHVADHERFLAEREHEATLDGTVTIEGLSADAFTVHGGRFNLFVDDAAAVETKLMRYRAGLVGSDGRRYYFAGEKTIHDDSGFDLWRDTTTLRVAVHEGDDETGPVILRGELRIAPADLIRQLRTMTVTGASDLRTRLRAMTRFGSFFAGELFESFGGPFARPSLFDPDAQRARRPLRLGEPEIHHFGTRDGLKLRLTRYRGGDKGPLILSHGLGVSSLIFAIDTIETNLVEHLFAAGYDCWLLDHRASIALGHAREQHTADDIADEDYPAAVAYVRERTEAPSVQMMAHCYGAMTFSMSMLNGLQGVRAAALSQISAHADVPLFPQRLLAHLHAPDVMRMLGVKVLDARATRHRDTLAKAIDGAIGLAYPFHRDDRSRSITSRRVTALYGQLYQLDQLNQATLDAVPEMFGKANLASFRQLARIARAGHVVRADGADTYFTDANLARFAIPTLFVHGALNRAFAPTGTVRTRKALSDVNGAHLYERLEVPGTGHIDCIFGRNAARTVFPAIVAHLDRTARP